MGQTTSARKKTENNRPALAEDRSGRHDGGTYPSRRHASRKMTGGFPKSTAVSRRLDIAEDAALGGRKPRYRIDYPAWWRDGWQTHVESRLRTAPISSPTTPPTPPLGRGVAGMKRENDRFFVIRRKHDRWSEKRSLQDGYMSEGQQTETEYHYKGSSSDVCENTTVSHFGEGRTLIRDLSVYQSHATPGYILESDARPEPVRSFHPLSDGRRDHRQHGRRNHRQHPDHKQEPAPDYDMDDVNYCDGRTLDPGERRRRQV